MATYDPHRQDAIDNEGRHRDNTVILDINCLKKNPTQETVIQFFYDDRVKQITWLDYQLHIQWEEIK